MCLFTWLDAILWRFVWRAHKNRCKQLCTCNGTCVFTTKLSLSLPHNFVPHPSHHRAWSHCICFQAPVFCFGTGHSHSRVTSQPALPLTEMSHCRIEWRFWISYRIYIKLSDGITHPWSRNCVSIHVGILRCSKSDENKDLFIYEWFSKKFIKEVVCIRAVHRGIDRRL